MQLKLATELQAIFQLCPQGPPLSRGRYMSPWGENIPENIDFWRL